jgi:hypothetical protein
MLRVVRSRDPVRCALCHSDLAAAKVACAVCRTAVHADCGAELVACPTLGCPRWRPMRRLSRSALRRLEAALVFLPSLLLAITGVALGWSAAGLPVLGPWWWRPLSVEDALRAVPLLHALALVAAASAFAGGWALVRHAGRRRAAGLALASHVLLAAALVTAPAVGRHAWEVVLARHVDELRDEILAGDGPELERLGVLRVQRQGDGFALFTQEDWGWRCDPAGLHPGLGLYVADRPDATLPRGRSSLVFFATSVPGVYNFVYCPEQG